MALRAMCGDAVGYMYTYTNSRRPHSGVTKEALRDWHLAIIPLAVVSGIPPGDIHHDGYHAGTIMAYGVRHMPHGMYSIWYYGYMHNGISPIRMLQITWYASRYASACHTLDTHPC